MSKIETVKSVPQSTSIDIIDKAIGSGLDVGAIGKLVDLHERMSADSARRLYVEAIAKAKAVLPVCLAKSRQVIAGPVKYKHVTLYDLCSAVSPVLAEHGLSYSWECEQPDARTVRVTCVVVHIGGHSERVSLQAPADEGRGRNSVQAIGSTVTYLQRYTLKSALGIAEADQDTEGRPQDSPATEAQIERIRALSSDDRVSEAGRERLAAMLDGPIGARAAQNVIAGAIKAIEERTGEKYNG